MSLADAARKAREKQASAQKAARKFDNDSLKQAAAAVETPQAKDDDAKPAKPAEAQAVNLEKKYRLQFAQLRTALKGAEAEGKRLHARLDAASPNNPVNGGYLNPTAIKRLHEGIAANDAKIAEIKTKLDDLTEELRKNGLPAKWAYE